VQAFNRGDYATSEQKIEEVLKRNRDNRTAIIAQGKIHLRREEYGSAVICFERAEALEPSGALSAMLAYGEAQSGHANPGRFHADRAIQQGFKTAEVLNLRGKCRLLSPPLGPSRFDEAERDLNAAIELEPNFGAAWLNLGYLHLIKWQQDRKLADIDRAVA